MFTRVDALIELQDALNQTAKSKLGYHAIDFATDVTEDVFDELNIEYKRRMMQRVFADLSDDAILSLIGAELTNEEFYNAGLAAMKAARE